MKLWPARSNKVTEAQGPITDLDAIVSTPVTFRYKGRIHTLKPMTVEEFLRFTSAQSVLLDTIKDDAKITPQELANRYHAVIASVCDSITVDDIMGMEQVQVAALYQLVIDLVTGQVDTNDSKKKRVKVQLYDYVQASSSPNVPESLAGQ